MSLCLHTSKQYIRSFPISFKMNPIYNRPDVKDYFNNNEIVSTYELKITCNISKQTAHDIIHRYLNYGWLQKYSEIKLPNFRRKLILYKVMKKEEIPAFQNQSYIY